MGPDSHILKLFNEYIKRVNTMMYVTLLYTMLHQCYMYIYGHVTSIPIST